MTDGYRDINAPTLVLHGTALKSHLLLSLEPPLPVLLVVTPLLASAPLTTLWYTSLLPDPFFLEHFQTITIL